MKLIDSTTKEEIKIGDNVTTFRGEQYILVGMTPPRSSDSNKRGARVHCKESLQEEWIHYWYPSVINAEFVQEDQVKEAQDDKQV